MKRIDWLVLISFIPPFIVAFSIALFVLLMQVIWIYMDEIAGKGLGAFEVAELLFYRSVGIIPMALPLGMLLASVMTLGNFGERYELSSMKSAGISLMRVLRPLMIFGLGITLFSWYSSDTLIPASNLKFGSRMYDIQQKKPALRLEEGVFNDDFQNFAIYIRKRFSDGRRVEGVLIYDHSEQNSGKIAVISAKTGEMYITSDGGRFVMQLREGHQYLQSPGSASSGSRYPFVRTAFGQYTRIFDLGEFQLSRTNEDLFRSGRQMMTAEALKIAADSIGTELDRRVVGLSNYMANTIHFLKTDSTYLRSETAPEEQAPADAAAQYGYSDNTQYVPQGHAMVPIENPGTITPQREVFSLKSVKSFLETFDAQARTQLINSATTQVQSVQSQADITADMVDRLRESRIKHVFDRHSKYSIALACFIFLFIGAPMGAIIRKGGFGYPILVATIFFILFVVMTIFCRKIAESFLLSAEAAAWLPCIIFFPLGLLLTRMAMNDSQLQIGAPSGKWRQHLKRAVITRSKSKPEKI
jgi:lipopolysaccharide export system permease protein